MLISVGQPLNLWEDTNRQVLVPKSSGATTDIITQRPKRRCHDHSRLVGNWKLCILPLHGRAGRYFLFAVFQGGGAAASLEVAIRGLIGACSPTCICDQWKQIAAVGSWWWKYNFLFGRKPAMYFFSVLFLYWRKFRIMERAFHFVSFYSS